MVAALRPRAVGTAAAPPIFGRLPGTDGLVHISELADHRVDKVEDILVEGDEVHVKCIGVDRMGKIRLSRREALAEAANE